MWNIDFKVRHHPLIDGLAGDSVSEVVVRVAPLGLETQGPLLFTHWGLSGPAILHLSAWGARHLHQLKYNFAVYIDWTGGRGAKYCARAMESTMGKENGACPSSFFIPHMSKGQWRNLQRVLAHTIMPALGRSTHKGEFVTAGGVALEQIDFRRFGGRVVPGLFLAGEVLDIDAITGGFNFQAAWTGGWLAGTAIARALNGARH